VLGVINRALARVGGAPLAAVADLFDVDEEFLCTFPELDPYPQRTGARYWGVAAPWDEGVTPEWPAGRGARILVYVALTYGDLDKVLRQLADLPHRSLVHVRALGSSASRYRSSNVAFSEAPVRMRSALADCELIVCHAGHGTVAQALLAGRPLVLAPLFIEGLLTARRVVSHGAAKMANPDAKAPNYKQLIREALDGACANEARAFATKYRDFDPDQQTRALADRCEELLESPRT